MLSKRECSFYNGLNWSQSILRWFVTQKDVKFLVPKKYRSNIIINDSVKFQKEFLEVELFFTYGMVNG